MGQGMEGMWESDALYLYQVTGELRAAGDR